MRKGHISHAKFVVTILSCCIILVPPGGITYGFNSISPYIYSLIVSKYPSTDKSQLSWVYSALMNGQAIAMIMGGWLEGRFKTRLISIFAVCMFNANLLLLHFSCQNIYSLILSYLVAGFTLGLIYVMALIVGLSWIEKHRHGLFSGLLSLGYGLSSVIVSPLETLYVNPNNVKPAKNSTSGELIFDNNEVLGKVPNMFIVYGIFSCLVQLPLSFLLVKNPEADRRSSDNETVKGMLRNPRFYLLFIIFALNKTPLAFIGSYAKFYGETFIGSDMTLSVVIGLSGIFNGLGRPFWGHIYDKFGVRASLFSLCLATSFSILLCYLSKFADGDVTSIGIFSIAVWASYFCCTGNYGIMPAATVLLFGEEGFGMKYGILYISQAAGALLSALFTSLIPFWMPLVLTIAASSVLSGLLALALKSSKSEDEETRGLTESSQDESFELTALVRST